MSHQLFVGEAVPVPAPSLPPAAQVSWSDVWRSASLGRPFRPVAMATLAGLASVNALVNYNGSAVQGLGYAAAQWVLVYASFAVLAALLAPAMRRMRVGSRTVTLIIASIVGLIPASLALAGIMVATGGANPWRVPLAIMLAAPAIAWVLALDQGFRQQVAAADAEQAAANAALEVAAALAGSAWRHEERRLSRALHGPVQTAVSAAAARIEAGDRAGAEAMLVEAVGRLDPASDDLAPVATALGDVSEFWNGLCTVDLDLEFGLGTQIDTRPSVAGVFVEICAEACSNAVRHGGAQHVTVRARREGDAVLLEVSDDGAPSGPESPGLGTALLDDVALAWERHRDGDHTVMRATLPLVA